MNLPNIYVGVIERHPHLSVKVGGDSKDYLLALSYRQGQWNLNTKYDQCVHSIWQAHAAALIADWWTEMLPDGWMLLKSVNWTVIEDMNSCAFWFPTRIEALAAFWMAKERA